MNTSREVRRSALLAVAPYLRCPHCGASFELTDSAAVCSNGHSFDIARQGYLNLAGSAGMADTAAMVEARLAFLAAGHYAPIADAISLGSGLAIDLGGGTGYYLAGALDRSPEARGICLDLSVPALRKAAAGHPRLAAIGADIWKGLPLLDNSVSSVLSVFGPRNPAEIDRVLVGGGNLTVVTPTEEHLAELIQPLGMIAVDRLKRQRLASAFGPPDEEEDLRFVVELSTPEMRALVSMGPSRHHMTDEELESRLAALGDRVAVTVSVRVNSYRKRSS